MPIFWVSARPFLVGTEFWKEIPLDEPYRVVLGYVRDKLYATRERSRQLLIDGFSNIPESSAFTNVEEVLILWFHANPFLKL